MDFGSSLVEAPPRIELGIKVLQTSALPLGYGAAVRINGLNNTIKGNAASTEICLFRRTHRIYMLKFTLMTHIIINLNLSLKCSPYSVYLSLPLYSLLQ